MKLTKLILKVSVPERVEYPTINPVPEGIHRPFWSVMIPTHNRARYLEQTLKSVLEQHLGRDEMQIEVIDNCSMQDDPEAVVRKVGQDRVSFYRQPSNVGMSANWTTCVKRARGYWVHILHNDDMVLPGFYDVYRRYITEHPQVLMVFCRAISMDAKGEWLEILYSPPRQEFSGIVEKALYKLVESNFIVTSSVVVWHDGYERLGGFHPSLSYTPDWEMWLRLAGDGSVGYIHHPYLLRRLHSEADTDRLALVGENMKQIVETIEIGLQQLSSKLEGPARSAAYRKYSQYALHWRSRLHSQGLHDSAFRHALWAVKLDPSVKNVLCLCKSFILSLGYTYNGRRNGGRER